MRDTISKSIYFALRDQIIAEINGNIKSDDYSKFIGILDMQGFGRLNFHWFQNNEYIYFNLIFSECFQDNSLEQLLINYANELLQKYCIENLIKKTQIDSAEEYVELDPYSETVIGKYNVCLFLFLFCF